MNQLLRCIATVAGLLLVGSAVGATTYAGSAFVGSVPVSLEITTDGTIGPLGYSNITSWTIDLTKSTLPGVGTVKMAGPDAFNQLLVLVGTGLSATATELRFDFSGNDEVQFIQTDLTGASSLAMARFALIGANSGGACSGCMRVFVRNTLGPNFFEARSGIQTIASAKIAPEPELRALVLGTIGVSAGWRRLRNASANRLSRTRGAAAATRCRASGPTRRA